MTHPTGVQVDSAVDGGQDAGHASGLGRDGVTGQRAGEDGCSDAFQLPGPGPERTTVARGPDHPAGTKDLGGQVRHRGECTDALASGIRGSRGRDHVSGPGIDVPLLDRTRLLVPRLSGVVGRVAMDAALLVSPGDGHLGGRRGGCGDDRLDGGCGGTHAGAFADLGNANVAERPTLVLGELELRPACLRAAAGPVPDDDIILAGREHEATDGAFLRGSRIVSGTGGRLLGRKGILVGTRQEHVDDAGDHQREQHDGRRLDTLADHISSLEPRPPSNPGHRIDRGEGPPGTKRTPALGGCGGLARVSATAPSARRAQPWLGAIRKRIDLTKCSGADGHLGQVDLDVGDGTDRGHHGPVDRHRARRQGAQGPLAGSGEEPELASG